jgi:hypothetical protein
MSYKNPQKKPKIYECKKCNYITQRINDYNKHLMTSKHIKVTKELQDIVKNADKKYKCICGNVYKYKQGLSNHKKKCKTKTGKEPILEPNNTMIIEIIKENQEFKKLILEQGKQLLEQNIKVSEQGKQLLEQNIKVSEQNKQVIELHKENNILINKLVEKESNTTINNTTNNNNQSFNLNIFLNETCKDAMNMKEFIDNIKVTFEELLTIGNTGFVNGVSDIFIKRLNDMEVTKRPIHCTDLKRETIYLKEDNEWNKDEKENTKLKDAIEKVENKNYVSLSEWCKKNPETNVLDSQKYLLKNKIFENTLKGDEKTREKVIKNITRKITINK